MSRYALHHDPAHLTEDILDLVVMLELSALIILAEAADVPKITQKVFIAACLVYCSVLSATPLFLPDLPNWDPDTKVQILFFAEMTPKSQFISAYGTMAVLLTKAAVSVILQKNDFMFLRCHYEYCLDQLDTSFAKTSCDGPLLHIFTQTSAVLCKRWACQTATSLLASMPWTSSRAGVSVYRTFGAA